MGTQVNGGENKKKVSSTISTIILILAIVIAILCSYTAFVTKAGNGVPSLFGIRPFSVQTDSMKPFFEQGDLIIDKAVDPATLKVGDVITFWTVINGYRVLNTHRIVNITDYGNYLYFDTKGDANPIADTTGVHQSEIVGKYITHIPKLGKFIDFLQTSKGFFICIVVPVAIFFIYQLIVFIKTLTAYNAEKMRLEYEQNKNNGEAPQTQAAPQPGQPMPGQPVYYVPQPQVDANGQPIQGQPVYYVPQPQVDANGQPIQGQPVYYVPQPQVDANGQPIQGQPVYYVPQPQAPAPEQPVPQSEAASQPETPAAPQTEAQPEDKKEE